MNSQTHAPANEDAPICQLQSQSATVM